MHRDEIRERQSLIKHWMAIFGERWGRSVSKVYTGEIMRALEKYHPDDLEVAFQRVFSECEFYPGVAEIIDRIEIRNRQFGSIAWIRPQGGTCQAEIYNGRKLLKSDGSVAEQKCACQNCAPWAYDIDGLPIAKLSRHNFRESSGPS
jgi:hypothetical protein